MNAIKIYKLTTLFLLLFYSCDSAKLSNDELKKMSNIKAMISVSNPIDTTKSSTIKVSLFNKKGKQLTNHLTIKVNGKDVQLHQKNELYRKHLWYETRLDYQEDYAFEMILPDSTKHSLGSVKPLESVGENNIQIKKTDANVQVSWKQLKRYNCLSIYIHTFDKITKEYNQKVYMSHKGIKSKEGLVTIPKNEYINDSIQTISIGFRFHAVKDGLINPNLMQGSQIISTADIFKSLEFDNQK